MRLFVIAAAALACACVPSHRHDTPGATAPAHNASSEARAMAISGEWVQASDQPAKASISFADGRASGSTGCNRWTASVDQTSGFRFGLAAVTEMACPGPAMDVEQRFLEVLSDTRSAEESGGMLTLKGAGGEELMRFVRPGGVLTGVEWRRVDDEHASPHGGTITFGEDGRAAGFAGCNRWFATVTRQGDQLSFGQAGLTRMMCPELQMAAERRFIAAISATRGYRIEGELLFLTDDAGAVLARFQRER